MLSAFPYFHEIVPNLPISELHFLHTSVVLNHSIPVQAPIAEHALQNDAVVPLEQAFAVRQVLAEVPVEPVPVGPEQLPVPTPLLGMPLHLPFEERVCLHASVHAHDVFGVGQMHCE